MFSKIIVLFTKKDKQLRSDRWIFSIILVAALLSLLAALVLSVEAVELARNPDAKLGCSINVAINCATVAKSSYASMFGFPNSFIGMMAEPVFIVIAIAALMGVKYTKKFMFATQIVSIFALMFAIFLFYISTVIIGALCPWCMLFMISTIVIFFAITRYNIRENNLYLSKSIEKNAKKYINNDYDKFLLALIVVVILAIIIIKYGEGLFA